MGNMIGSLISFSSVIFPEYSVGAPEMERLYVCKKNVSDFILKWDFHARLLRDVRKSN